MRKFLVTLDFALEKIKKTEFSEFESENIFTAIQYCERYLSDCERKLAPRGFTFIKMDFFMGLLWEYPFEAQDEALEADWKRPPTREYCVLLDFKRECRCVIERETKKIIASSVETARTIIRNEVRDLIAEYEKAHFFIQSCRIFWLVMRHEIE